jgi:hypothetical protein
MCEKVLYILPYVIIQYLREKAQWGDPDVDGTIILR